MIRYVKLSGLCDDHPTSTGDAECARAHQFAFYDTVREAFLDFAGDQAFDSVEEFLESATYQGLSPEFLERCLSLIPSRSRVVTSGCFDVLHTGHVRLLRTAATMGSLTVLVNDDESVRRIKGPGRPTFPLAERVEMLEALSCVDEVVSFGEDDPSEAIRRLTDAGKPPTVYVKGSEYEGRDIPERVVVEAVGGVVVLLGPKMYSSSGLLRQLEEDITLYADPAHKDACKVLGCHEVADSAHEESMFNTESGALSPYRNHSLTWCRIHGELFEATRRLEELARKLIEARRARCRRWL